MSREISFQREREKTRVAELLIFFSSPGGLFRVFKLIFFFFAVCASLSE